MSLEDIEKSVYSVIFCSETGTMSEREIKIQYQDVEGMSLSEQLEQYRMTLKDLLHDRPTLFCSVGGGRWSALINKNSEAIAITLSDNKNHKRKPERGRYEIPMRKDMRVMDTEDSQIQKNPKLRDYKTIYFQRFPKFSHYTDYYYHDNRSDYRTGNEETSSSQGYSKSFANNSMLGMQFSRINETLASSSSGSRKQMENRESEINSNQFDTRLHHTVLDPSSELHAFIFVKFQGFKNFTVRLVENTTNFVSIQEALREHASSSTSMPSSRMNWKTGDGCLVTDISRGSCYRGLILKNISDRTFSILLLDVGETVERDDKDLKTLPKAQLSTPPMALRCSLAVNGEQIVSKFENRDGVPAYDVELLMEKEDGSFVPLLGYNP